MAFSKDFTPSSGITSDLYVVRKLCAKDVYLDYMAFMSSIDIIKQIRGGCWPTPDISFEDDLIDLSWHQREFEFGNSFAYTIMNVEEDCCLGCCYFYPIEYSFPEKSDDYDIDFSFWVTKDAYQDGLYEELFEDFVKWIKKEWGSFKVLYRNIEIPDSVKDKINTLDDKK